jgi:hypothetical protein
MATLHIEHAITDFALWSSAFNRFADARERAGVRGHRVQRPVDDREYVVIDLDFETKDQAGAFLAFLKRQVWETPENAPALAGTPGALILEPAATQ